MTFREKITFFYALEEHIWNEKVEANKYLATLSILFVAILGGIVGGGNTFAEMFNWDTAPSLLSILSVCILVWGANVAESIIASANGWVALGRSALMLLVMAVAFALGFLLAVVVIIIVCLILILLFASGALKGALSGGGSGSSSSNREEYEELDFGLGNKVRGRSSWDGNTFNADNGDTYHKVDGGWIKD